MTFWTYSLVAKADGVVARLNKPLFHSAEVRGCGSVHQVGLWTSDKLRPKGQMRYGEATEFAPIGRLNFVPADVPWVARLDHQAKLRSALYCDFDRDLFRRVSGIEADDTPQFLKTCLSVDSPKLQQAIWLLLGEVQNPGFAQEIAVESLGHLILVELGRYFKSVEQSVEWKGGKLSSWQLERLRAYVEEVEGRPLTVADMAELCGISPVHVRRLFKATTGTTISDYVEITRMARARSMLVDKRIPLKEIAFRLGFASGSSFSTAFRRAAGITPMAYRQMVSS